MGFSRSEDTGRQSQSKVVFFSNFTFKNYNNIIL